LKGIETKKDKWDLGSDWNIENTREAFALRKIPTKRYSERDGIQYLVN
jgi:hypothetical protein